MSSKKTYHTFIQIAYNLNILPEEIENQIPKTTKFNWNKRDDSQSFGYDWCIQQESRFKTLKGVAASAKLTKMCNIYLRIVGIFRETIRHCAGYKNKIRQCRFKIIKTIERLKPLIGLTASLKIFFLSQPSYYLWSRQINCRNSVLSWCSKKHPQQLHQTEVQAIKKYCIDERFLHWPLISVYYKMLKESSAFMSKQAFYKYVYLLGLKRYLPKSRRKNHTEGIRAKYVGEILHADVTIFRPIDHTKVYIYFVQDNFSRAILSWRASLKISSAISLENLEEAIAKLPALSKPLTLITDDGSENAGEVTAFVKNNDTIKHIIAQKDIIQSNSMIESVNKKIKYGFLFRKDIADYKQTLLYIEEAVNDFNSRPHGVLFGSSPDEILINGKTENDEFKRQIAEARTKRINLNQNISCCIAN